MRGRYIDLLSNTCPWFLSPKEVATLLGCTREDVDVLRAANAFPTTPYGPSYRVATADFKVWAMEAGKTLNSPVFVASEPHRHSRRKGHRRHGDGSITSWRRDGRPDGVRGIIELPRDTDGKRRRKSFYGQTEEEVLSKMNAYRRGLAAGKAS